MTRLFYITALFIFCIHFTKVNAQKNDHLLQCWEQQVKPLQGQYLSFTYQEQLNKLLHSFKPWQQTTYTCHGKLWINAGNFLKEDTLARGTTTYYSKTLLNETDLLFLDYGDKELYGVTRSMFQDYIFETARYSPVRLIDYCFTKKIAAGKESTQSYAIYQSVINKAVVKLYIRKQDNLLEKVTILSDDELYGDVLTTFTYNKYITVSNLSLPSIIDVEKINGKLKEQVTISDAAIVNNAPVLLEKPDQYTYKTEDETQADITVERYGNNLHFIDMKHTNDKVLIVEFKDFLLVAEAPLNSRNGDLIIREAQKIAPGKPIRYFIFSHYHPHYLGGMRPFIHKGAKVLCAKDDVDYVTYLYEAPHSLNPDSLHLQRKPLNMETISDSMTISDGLFTMNIFFIGEKSAHTNDYLIYYFPTEKLLFQGDLVWIPKEGVIKKASARQAGLYNAIKERNLDVQTVIQSWPVSGYEVKTIIPFADIETSMNVD